MNSSDFLLSRLEQIANGYLSLDPEISQPLSELEGQVLLFDITSPDIRVYCLPQTGQLQSSWELEPDCTVRGSAQGLLKMIRSDSPTEALSNGDIEIKGDSRLAQRFSDILSSIEVDWEDIFSRFVGDFAAHKMGRAVSEATLWAKDSLKATQLNTVEYLQEEIRVLPTSVEIDYFMQDVDTLRSDIDRAEARLKRLERQDNASQKKAGT